MTMQQYRNIQPGDIVVMVRKGYQNNDHTVVPCTPEVYTFEYKSSTSSVGFKEKIKHSWLNDEGTRCVHGTGMDVRYLVRDFELLETYLSGEYYKDIMLDKSKWKNLKEFLLFKMENDYKEAKQIDSANRAMEDAEYLVHKGKI